jgi:hypothetical protein
MLRVRECKAYITSDMRSVHVVFLAPENNSGEIRTADVVSMNLKRARDDHIPGVVGKTTCSFRLCSGLLTVSLPAFSSPPSVLVP